MIRETFVPLFSDFCIGRIQRLLDFIHRNWQVLHHESFYRNFFLGEDFHPVGCLGSFVNFAPTAWEKAVKQINLFISKEEGEVGGRAEKVRDLSHGSGGNDHRIFIKMSHVGSSVIENNRNIYPGSPFNTKVLLSTGF